MHFKTLLSAVVVGIGLALPAGGTEVPVIWGDKQEILHVVDELKLEDDKRMLVHAILEEARVTARRIYQDVGAELGQPTTLLQRVQTASRLADLERETMDDLASVLTEEEMGEVRRSALLVHSRNQQEKSRRDQETAAAAAYHAL